MEKGAFVSVSESPGPPTKGLVHTAPGHGAEDYLTGLKYGLPPLSPVDDAGKVGWGDGWDVGCVERVSAISSMARTALIFLQYTRMHVGEVSLPTELCRCPSGKEEREKQYTV